MKSGDNVKMIKEMKPLNLAEAQKIVGALKDEGEVGEVGDRRFESRESIYVEGVHSKQCAPFCFNLGK